MNHQVVARENLDCAGRPDQAKLGVGERTDRAGHGVQPVQLIRDRRCVEVRQPVDQVGRAAIDLFAKAKPGAGMHLRSLRLPNTLRLLHKQPPLLGVRRHYRYKAPQNSKPL